MPQISKQKKDKISEQILFYLYQSFPRQLFTSDIAKEVARDEEFIKQIMIDLQKKELVIKIDKNSNGISYKRRLRWRLSNKAHDIYAKHNNHPIS
jgi:predicted transcriptional regulator with HTH domain